MFISTVNDNHIENYELTKVHSDLGQIIGFSGATQFSKDNLGLITDSPAITNTYLSLLSPSINERPYRKVTFDFETDSQLKPNFFTLSTTMDSPGVYVQPVVSNKATGNDLSALPYSLVSGSANYNFSGSLSDKSGQVFEGNNIAVSFNFSGTTNPATISYINLSCSGDYKHNNVKGLIRGGSDRLEELPCKISNNIYADTASLETNGERFGSFLSNSDTDSLFPQGYFNSNCDTGSNFIYSNNGLSSGHFESGDIASAKSYQSYFSTVSGMRLFGDWESKNNSGNFTFFINYSAEGSGSWVNDIIKYADEGNSSSTWRVREEDDAFRISNGIQGINRFSPLTYRRVAVSVSDGFGSIHYQDNLLNSNLNNFSTSDLAVGDYFGYRTPEIVFGEGSVSSGPVRYHQIYVNENGNLSKTEIENFFNDKYVGSGVFNKGLMTPAESNFHCMRLNISGYTGNASSNHNYYVPGDGSDSIIYRDAIRTGIYQTQPSGLTAWFNRYIEKPDHSELILNAVEQFEGIDSSPQFRIWTDNQSSSAYSGVKLKSKLYIENYEFIGEDITVPHGTNLITSRFTPSTNSLSSGWVIPTKMLSSGNINFCFELEEPDNDIKPVDIDVKFYSADVKFFGYVSPATVPPTGNPLYTKGLPASTTPLYIKGSVDNSQTIPLYTSGTGFDTQNLPLYIHNPVNDLNHGGGSQTPLYVQSLEELGFGDNPAVPLFVDANPESDATLPLFVRQNGILPPGPTGQPPAGETYDVIDSVPLYLFNSSGVSNTVDLHLLGGIETQNLNLFVNGNVSSGTNSIPLNIYSATNSGVYQNTTLFVNGDVSATVPLYIQSSGDFRNNSTLPLYLNGYMSEGFTPLYLHNDVLQSGGNIDMYVKGANIRSSGQMPLFMSRPNNADRYAIPLYLNTSEPNNKTLNLFISGADITNNNVNLHVSGGGDLSKTTELYTHGF